MCFGTCSQLDFFCPISVWLLLENIYDLPKSIFFWINLFSMVFCGAEGMQINFYRELWVFTSVKQVQIFIAFLRKKNPQVLKTINSDKDNRCFFFFPRLLFSFLVKLCIVNTL